MDNDNYNHNDYGWGMPRKFYTPVKYYSVAVFKGLIAVAVALISFQLYINVFPVEQFFQFLLFFICINSLTIYLMLPTKGGSSNIVAIMTYLFRRKHKYYSIDRNVYPKYLGYQRERKVSSRGKKSTWKR